MGCGTKAEMTSCSKSLYLASSQGLQNDVFYANPRASREEGVIPRPVAESRVPTCKGNVSSEITPTTLLTLSINLLLWLLTRLLQQCGPESLRPQSKQDPCVRNRAKSEAGPAKGVRISLMMTVGPPKSKYRPEQIPGNYGRTDLT